MTEIESRTWASKVELRGEGDEPRGIAGVAPPWETLSTKGRLPWREVFSRGAFDMSAEMDLISSPYHEDAKILGRTGNGSLVLRDTAEGMEYYVPNLPATSYAADLREQVRSGLVTESSFEFIVKRKADGHDMDGEQISRNEDGEIVRRIVPKGAIPRQFGPVVKAAFADSPEVALRAESRAEQLKRMAADFEARADAPLNEARAAARRRKLALAEAELL